MEAFPTNGSDEWTHDASYANMGLYNPTLGYININFDSKTVNGQPFTAEASVNKMSKVGNYHHSEADCYYIDKASCNFKMMESSNARPKFYDGVSSNVNDTHFVVAYGYRNGGTTNDNILVFDPANNGSGATGRDTTLANAISWNSKTRMLELRLTQRK